MNPEEPKTEAIPTGINPNRVLSDQLIQKAFTMYMQKEARKAAIKQPHKDKVKKARRAKNKVQRASRKKNR